MRKSNTAVVIFLVLLSLMQVSTSFRHFQALIPNGASVVDPCNGRASWSGVGHQTQEGRTDRNPFGHDFFRHGKVWTKELCQLDSDGDGLTNGEELGDPDCLWTPGEAAKGPSISHPGICEPLSSPKCSSNNVWLDCNKVHNLEHAVCDSINDQSTVSRDLRMTPTLVPPKETTYFCQLFDLDMTSDLHMVATQPLLNVSEVVHHILMFGCDPKVEIDQELRSPYPCVMVPHEGCRSLIGAWTVGSPGECAHPEMGFRVGPGGYRTVAIQIHWNNPGHIKGIVDNSGLRIHLTNNLRKNDAGMLVVGQQYLEIESGQQGTGDLSFSAVCPERCTKVMFSTPIYITSAVNHMHYLGKSQEIKVYKNNSHIGTITDQDNYHYDDPIIYTFKEPIKVNPGEEIRTTCVYKRTSSPNPVCWGESTSEEMCFGFITYYPLQSLSHPWCTSVDNFPSCDRHLPALGNQPIDNCRWWEFRNTSHPQTKQMMGRIIFTCFPGKLSLENLVCSPECQAVTRKIAEHPCMKGDAGKYMADRMKLSGEMGQQLLEAIVTCSCRDFSYCDKKTPQGVLLGSRRHEFCTSSSAAPWPHFLLYVIMVIILLGQL